MCSRIIPIFGFIISISSFIYLFKIRSNTKEDLFQQQFELGKKEKLFYNMNLSSIALTDKLIKCELYQEAIMNPKVNKLGIIFNLNNKNIYKRTTQLIIVFIFFFVFLTLHLLMLYFYAKTKSAFVFVFAYIILLAKFVLFFVNFIITIFLVVDFYKGDTYRFLDFLECKNLNKDEFSNYLYVKKLKNYFIIFVILNIISSMMNYKSNEFTPATSPRRKRNIEPASEQPSIVVVDNKKH